MENKEIVRENKMGTMPVNKLLLNMSLPMMASMLVQAMYNIVDSIFVSRVSEGALTAVTLSFPIQMLIIAVGGGTGVGVNAVLSKALGEKNHDEVKKAATNGVFLIAMSYIVFLIIGLFGVKPFFATQKVGDVRILNYGIQYLSIVCICSVGVLTQMTFERLLQSTGKTMYSMISQMTGAIINCIMDPILIFGLFGAPRLEVAGAALATIFGQIVGASLAIFFNLTKNKEVVLSFKGFRPEGRMIRKIYAVGLPSIIMQSIGSVMNYCMNQILLGFSGTAAAVFGIYYKLQSFFFMPVFGLNNGLIPIVAFNYGAKNRKRMLKAIKLSILYAELIFFVGVIAFEFFPDKLLMIFDASPEMLEIGSRALRTIGLNFPIAAFCIITGTVFQSLGYGTYSLWVSVARQLAVLIPVAYLLSLTGVVHNVWWAFPISELASAIASAFFFAKIYNHTIKEIPPGVD